MRCTWQPRRIKQTRKTKLLKKLDVVVMEKWLWFIYPFPNVLNIAWHIYFRPDQICAKCYQIAAVNKSTDDFIFPSVFLSLCHFKMFITSASSI